LIIPTPTWTTHPQTFASVSASSRFPFISLTKYLT
jgi:hypothetical protein